MMIKAVSIWLSTNIGLSLIYKPIGLYNSISRRFKSRQQLERFAAAARKVMVLSKTAGQMIVSKHSLDRC